MNYQKLEVNMSIEIQKDEDPFKGSYQSKIADISTREIQVLTPYKNGQLVPLRVNSEIKVLFNDENAAYKFTSTIIAREREPIPVLTITPPEEFVRIQRREFFRLEIQTGVKYCRVDTDGNKLEDLKKTLTVDVSGGGIRMVVDEELEPDTLLKLFLDIPEIDTVPISGIVVRIYDAQPKKSAGVEFEEIEQDTRDKIIGWLFDKQRELRRKGLL